MHDVKFAHFNEGLCKGSGFCMMIDADFSKGLIPAITNEEVQSKVIEIVNYSLKVYWEIHDNCPFIGWVEGLAEL